MIRIFNHYMHRPSLVSALIDAVVVMAAIFAAVLLQAGPGGDVVPVAGTRGFSLAAGILCINAATGFYEVKSNRSYAELFVRAAVALALALPLTYLAFSLMPAGFGNRSAMQLVAMAGVAAVILHRGYETATSAAQ